MGGTDLYALGGVMYEMLTGRTPFEAESYEAWAAQHLKVAPKPPSAIRGELTGWPGLDGLVLRLLEKDRDKRPGDVTELLGLLDGVRHVEPVGYQNTEVEPAGAKREASLAEAMPLKGKGVPGARTRLVQAPDGTRWRSVVVVSALLAAALGLAAWYQVERSSRPKEAVVAVKKPTLKRPALKKPEFLIGHTKGVAAVAYSPDGKIIASAGNDHTVRLWDAATGKELKVWNADTGFESSLAFSPDGKTLALGGYGDVKLWQMPEGRELESVPMDGSIDHKVAFSPDGGTLAISDRIGEKGNNGIKLWDIANRRVLQSFGCREFAFNPRTGELATEEWLRPGIYKPGDRVEVWEPKGDRFGPSSRSYHRDNFGGQIAFSPDGSFLVWGGKDIQIWELLRGQMQSRLPPFWSFSRLPFADSHVAMSPVGNRFASWSLGGPDMSVRLWDWTEEPSDWELSAFEQDTWAHSVSFSPDGETMAVASGDQAIRLYSLKPFRALGKPERVQ